MKSITGIKGIKSIKGIKGLTGINGIKDIIDIIEIYSKQTCGFSIKLDSSFDRWNSIDLKSKDNPNPIAFT